jgi:hypothetical protein
MAGTLAFLNIWHGVTLTSEEISDLYAPYRLVPSHDFDFRGCDGSTTADSSNPSYQTFVGMTAQDVEECSIDGALVNTDSSPLVMSPPVAWGGAISVEVLVKHSNPPEGTNARTSVLWWAGDSDAEPLSLGNDGSSGKLTLTTSHLELTADKATWGDGEWSHVVAVVEGTTGRIYLNGELAAEGEGSLGETAQLAEPGFATRATQMIGNGNSGLTVA